MRFFPLIPIIFSVAAFIISILCIFAGSKPGFMEDYAILMLNTSRIGQNIVDKVPSVSPSSSSDNPVLGWLQNVTSSVTDDIQDFLSGSATSLAHEIGVHDFYSAHLLTHCEGEYVPGPIPNATLKASAIHRNVTKCSNRTVGFDFDPGAAIRRSLNETGTGITLEDLGWPEEIDDGIKGLKGAITATFVLYCIGTGLCFFAALASIAWMFTAGRAPAFGAGGFALAAFLVLGIASAIATAVSVKGDKIIDKYGGKIGVSADRGNGFLALTWVATALMFVTGLIACGGCCFGRREKVKMYGEK